ncbi:MAG: alpha/beta hydrolase [Velocimicrobium sp.]
MEFKILIIVIVVCLVVLILGSIYFFWFSFIRQKPKYQGDYETECRGIYQPFKEEMLKGKEWIHNHRDDRITITSRDGLKLVGFYIPAPNVSNNTILMMHGYRSDSYGDFCYLAQFFHENGYNLLIPHQRCHGESEGKYIGFGVLERHDCKQWIMYLNDRFGVNQNLYLAGVSMGCSTVLMTLGLDLPNNIKAVIADCGFTSPFDIFRHVLKRNFRLPVFPVVYIENFLCKHIVGYEFKECSTIEILKENEIPVLFIHGEEDDFVPTFMGRENYEACKSKKELLIVEGAGHATASMQEPQKYRDTALRFLKEAELLSFER